MEAVVFSSHSVVHNPSFFSFNKQQPKLGKFNLSMKEIADVPSFPQLTFSSIRSDGSRRGQPPRKSPASKRTTKGNNNNILQPSGGGNTSSSSQKEIIALFRRIQTSISKGDSANAKKNDSNLSEKKTSVEPVLEIIRRSRRQVKDTTSDKREDKVLSKRRGLPKNEQKFHDNTPGEEFMLTQALSKEQELEDNPTLAEFKPTRLPSNFVKKSPIPSALASRQSILTPNGEISANTPSKEVSKSPSIEKLKLHELKELAKSRGIKGYSRTRKSKLVKLLRS